MTELSDYQRTVEKPQLERFNDRLRRRDLQIAELRIAAQQATAIALEAAALVADNAAKEAERVGLLHGESTDNRSRLFARAREATAIAERIRKLKPPAERCSDE